MTEILTQNEIDSLLTAISTGEIESADYGAGDDRKIVKIYDFRRPDKFSRDQVRIMQMIHETFSRLSTLTVSARTMAYAALHVASVDQVTYEEFIRSIPNPTLLAVIAAEPLEGSVLLEIDPSIAFTMYDLLAGGAGEPSRISRELTDIEISVIEVTIAEMVKCLGKAWSGVIALRPGLSRFETNPQFAQVVPPNDLVLLVTIEARLGSVEGMINLCLPYITLEPVMDRLTAKYLFSGLQGRPGPSPAGEIIRTRGRFRKYASFALERGLSSYDLETMKRGGKLRIETEPAGKVRFGNLEIE